MKKNVDGFAKYVPCEVSKEVFEQMKLFTGDEMITGEARAAAYYYINKNSYKSSGEHFSDKRGIKNLDLSELSNQRRLKLLKQNSERLKDVEILNKDYREILKTYDNDRAFFYLDSPYLTRHAGWSTKQITEYCGQVKQLKGKWLLSFNDCGLIRELVQGYEIIELERNSSVSNRYTAKTFKEVLIKNY